MKDRSALLIHEEVPLNAETRLEAYQADITPNEAFFVRSHGPVPELDAETYQFEVKGLVDTVLTLSIADLRTRFEQHSVTATLQCAGNRRQQLFAMAFIPGEVAWFNGAVSTATWTGVKLSDVIKAVGYTAQAKHVAFTGHDVVRQDPNGFGGSIPLEKALASETLLAYEMNGHPLPPDHGYPLRVVVPGYLGARSVKWLRDITLSDAPSPNYFQQRAYKLFAPDMQPDAIDWSKGMMLGEMNVNALITTPTENSQIAHEGLTRVRGFAVTSGGRAIDRIDVSTDGGKTWKTATKEDQPSVWAWCWWNIELDLPAGEHEIIARAWDTAANTQPENPVWNCKGYMNNAWHRVKVTIG